jgi:hypothetical protein
MSIWKTCLMIRSSFSSIVYSNRMVPVIVLSSSLFYLNQAAAEQHHPIQHTLPQISIHECERMPGGRISLYFGKNNEYLPNPENIERLDYLKRIWSEDGGVVLLTTYILTGENISSDQALPSALNRLNAVSQSLQSRGVSSTLIWTQVLHSPIQASDGGVSSTIDLYRRVDVTLPSAGRECRQLMQRRIADWFISNCTSPHILPASCSAVVEMLVR